MRMACKFIFAAAFLLLAGAAPVRAEDAPTYTVVLKGRAFDPARVTVPPGVKLVLVVRNAEESVVEFESETLKVEKLITAGRQATVRLGPLEKGEYPFTDDFHKEAQGVLVVGD